MTFAELPDSENLLVKKGNQLHLAILGIVAAFSVFYSVLHWLNGAFKLAKISILLVPVVFIAYLLYKHISPSLSKIFNLIAVTTIVTLISMYAGQQTFVLAFFVPILVSTLIVFQGKDKKLGLTLTVLSCIYLLVLMIFGSSIPPGRTYTKSELLLEQGINLLGALLVTLSEVGFILFLGNKIQSQLLETQEEFWKKNIQLRAAVESRDKIMAVMSHDIRSPLTITQSGLKYLAEDINDEKNIIITELEKRVSGTLKLVDNLLLWARSQTDTFQINKKPISESEFTELIDSIFLLQSNPKVRLEKRIHHQGIFEADRNTLEAIFRNLISNAIKFSSEEGVVIVSSEICDERKCIQFSVTDNGVGMPMEIVEKLQKGISHTTLGTKKEKGYGIGLMLVSEFIKLHGGELAITSVEGQGSTFSFTLNLSQN